MDASLLQNTSYNCAKHNYIIVLNKPVKWWNISFSNANSQWAFWLEKLRLQAETPVTAGTKHILWEIPRTERITDIKVSPTRDCSIPLNQIEDATVILLITSFQDTRMELICKNNSELNIRETLFKNRQMSVAR